MKLPVTVVIPTRNEARNLPQCLSALDEFQHVVVVDSASTDDTRVIARAHGAQVLDFVWNGTYPKKRNWVLLTQTLPTEWVLFLDADERVTPAFVAELRARLSPDCVGYWITYRNHFMGRELRFGVRQRKLSLFRVGAGLYERIDEDHWSALDMEVHEHPVLQGRIDDIRAPLVHDDFKSLHHFFARHNEYSSWEARRVFTLLQGLKTATLTRRQRLKYRFVTQAWFAFAYFGLQYVAKLGFLDGRAGLLYAFYKFCYFQQVYEKHREYAGDHRRSPPADRIP